MGEIENPGKIIESIYTDLNLRTVKRIFNFSVKIYSQNIYSINTSISSNSINIFFY